MRRATKVLTLLAPVMVGAVTAVTLATGPIPAAVAAPPFSEADVTDEFVAGGTWHGVTAADWMSDGRMLVVRVSGQVMVVNPVTSSVTELFVVPNLLTLGESGLLDVLVDKNFASNKFFYTYSVNGTTRRPQVDRFTFSASGAAVLASRQTIWTSPSAARVCCNYHVGGSINVGPDGKLYIAIGDNEEGTNAQDLTTVFGKVLRVNLDGTVPADNPFVDGAGPHVDEIWAYGLRNPYRASFDTATGQFWVADVGGNVDTTAYEEVDIVEKGKNYGWPNCEGPLGPPKNGPSCPAGTAGPIYAYTHNVGQGCCGNKAIIGGDVYRGSAYPAGFAGTYIYADYPTGIFYWLQTSGGVTSGELKHPSIGGANPTWVGVSPVDGQIYWLHYGWQNDGQLRRLRFVATGAHPPTITQASATPTSGNTPLTVQFTAAASDLDGDAISYSWDFNDDGTVDSTQQNPSFTYTADGQYLARLVVRAGSDLVAAPPITIKVGTPPTATITSPAASFAAGQTISLTGTGSPGSTLAWSVAFRHNEHTHPVVSGTGPTLSFPVETTGHTWDGNTAYEVTLTATNASGLTGTATQTLLPQKRAVPVSSNVPGLVVTVDGIARTTPAMIDTIVGFHHVVSAPASSCDGSTLWTFSSWNGGGTPRTHTFVVPSGAAALTAHYVPAGSCAPTLYRAINLNGPAMTVDGTPFDSGAAAGVSAGPGSFCDTSVPLNPATSAQMAQMLRCSIYGDGDPGARVDVSGVPDGAYLVTLWVWEDNKSETFDILLNGVPAAIGVVSGPPGTWKKLGPFSTAVDGGTLQIASRGGAANISGVRIDRPAVESLPPGTSSELVSISPARLMDSRPGQPPTIDNLFQGFGPLTTGTVTELQVTGRAGVPSDATAAVLNVTVTEPQGDGFVTVFPCGSGLPNAANLNYVAGQTIPNAVIAKIGAGGKVCLYTINTTHVVVDLNGWFPTS